MKTERTGMHVNVLAAIVGEVLGIGGTQDEVCQLALNLAGTLRTAVERSIDGIERSTGVVILVKIFHVGLFVGLYYKYTTFFSHRKIKVR
jgi:hypothetical protein